MNPYLLPQGVNSICKIVLLKIILFIMIVCEFFSYASTSSAKKNNQWLKNKTVNAYPNLHRSSRHNAD